MHRYEWKNIIQTHVHLSKSVIRTALYVAGVHDIQQMMQLEVMIVAIKGVAFCYRQCKWYSAILRVNICHTYTVLFIAKTNNWTNSSFSPTSVLKWFVWVQSVLAIMNGNIGFTTEHKNKFKILTLFRVRKLTFEKWLKLMNSGNDWYYWIRGILA